MIRFAAYAAAGLLTLLAVVNLLCALAIGYTLAAGADDVYHGVELPALANYMAGVGITAAPLAILSWVIIGFIEGELT